MKYKINHITFKTDPMDGSVIIKAKIDRSYSKSCLLAMSEIKLPANKDKKYNLEISEFKEKRTLNQNSYLFMLCDKIAKKVSNDADYQTKYTVYRKAIRECGYSARHTVPNSLVADMLQLWNKDKYSGKFCEIVTDYGLCSEMIFYKGSSNYNVKQMQRLIDCIVQDAKALGINTDYPYKIIEAMQLGETNDS